MWCGNCNVASLLKYIKRSILTMHGPLNVKVSNCLIYLDIILSLNSPCSFCLFDMLCLYTSKIIYNLLCVFVCSVYNMLGTFFAVCLL